MSNYLSKIKRKISKLLHPVVGEVWCLHRVVPVRSVFDSNRELEITPDYLEKLILDYKKNGYEFTTVDTIFAKSRLSWSVKRRKLVNVSFDDGFADIYHNAFPLFCKYQVPFTVYLTSDFPDKMAKLWWMAMDVLICEKDVVVLGDGTEHVCRTKEQKQQLFESLMDRIYNAGKMPLACFDELFPHVYPQYEDRLNELVLSWQMLEEMVASGLCTVGSHTVSHPDLTKLDSEELRREIAFSACHISDKLNCKVIHFSYPHSFVDARIAAEVRKAGYKTAALGYGGSIRVGDSPYMLFRKYIKQPN